MAYQLDPVTGQMVYVNDFATPQANYTNPNFAFGYDTQPAAMNTVGLTQQPTGMAGMGTYPMNQTPNAFNLTGTQDTFATSMGAAPSVYGTGQEAIDSMGAVNNATGGNGWGSVTPADWLNFGLQGASLGAGIYFQNQALDQQQQSLDLARDKYNTYQQEQQELDAAYQSFT